jgi:hypothetical protein
MARYFGVPRDDIEFGFGDKDVGNYEFAEQEVRLGFVRKVFGKLIRGSQPRQESGMHAKNSFRCMHALCVWLGVLFNRRLFL